MDTTINNHTKPSTQGPRRANYSFRSADNRRLSWPENTIGYQLVHCCLH